MSRRALVTGASSGIGRAFAVELAKQGWDLVLVARDGERLARVRAELGGGPHEALAADLATAAGCGTVMRRIERPEDPVELLVNSAGLGTGRGYPEAEIEQEEAQLAVNVTAVMRLSWAAARAMRERGGGAIVNIASTAAFWSSGTYAASKAWVLKASEALAASSVDTPVRVLCVIPGFTRTELHSRSDVDNSGVASWLWLQPTAVARESLRALDQGHATFVPGRQYRLLLPLVRLLPMRGRRALLRRLAPLAPRSRWAGAQAVSAS